MPIGNNFPRSDNPDPLPPDIIRMAAGMIDATNLLASRGYYRDQLREDDSLREKLKAEIQDSLLSLQKELPIFHDYREELSQKTLEILARIEQDIAAINSYLEDAWPEYPYEALVSDVKLLYQELENANL